MKKNKKYYGLLSIAILFCACLLLVVLNVNALGLAQAEEKNGCIYIGPKVTFTMNGGTIKHDSSENGPALYIDSGASFIYSSGTIEGDVYFNNSSVDTYITCKSQPTSTLQLQFAKIANGTKIAKLDGISTIDLTKLNVTNMPSGYELKLQTISGVNWVVAEQAVNQITITIEPDSYGSVSMNKVVVDEGTRVYAVGRRLYVGDQVVVATPDPGCSFERWGAANYTGEGQTIYRNTTIWASFEQSEGLYDRIGNRGAINIGLVGSSTDYGITGYCYLPSKAELDYVMAIMLEMSLGSGNVSLDDLDLNDYAAFTMGSEDLMEFLTNEHDGFFDYDVNFINFPQVETKAMNLLNGLYGNLMETETYDSFMEENDLDILLSDYFWTSSYIEEGLEWLPIAENDGDYSFDTFGTFFDYSYQKYFMGEDFNYSESIYNGNSLIEYLNMYFNLGPQDSIIGTSPGFDYKGGSIFDELFEGCEHLFSGIPDNYTDKFYMRLILPFLFKLQLGEVVDPSNMYERENYIDIILETNSLARTLEAFTNNGSDYANFAVFAPIWVWTDMYNNNEINFSLRQLAENMGYNHDIYFVDILGLFLEGFDGYEENLFGEYDAGEGRILEPIVQTMSDMIKLGLAHKAIYMRTEDINLNGGEGFVLDFLTDFRASGLSNECLLNLFMNRNFQERETNVQFLSASDEYDWDRGYNYIRSRGICYESTNYNQLILDTKKYYLEPIVDKSHS